MHTGQKMAFPLLLMLILTAPLQATETGPELTGKAALSLDAGTDEIIYALNIDTRMYPASITKLVTALLLARLKEKEDLLYYSAEAKASWPYKLDLPEGTHMRAEDAMDALLLFSANDVAWMIAENL